MKPSELRRRSQRCSCRLCFYCDTELARHEHDHFPVPRSAGGTRVVGACLDCHDYKDRIPLHLWDREASWTAHKELFQGFDRSQHDGLYGNDLLAALWQDPLLSETAIMARWGSLTPMARVLYAKMRATHELDLRRRSTHVPDPS